VVAPSHSRGESAERWDSAYVTKGSDGVSWYEAEPATSLALIEALRVPSDAAVIDIGGGASALAERLLDRAFSDLTILDISAIALDESRRQRRNRDHIQYLRQDLLSWQPQRRYDLWHDRGCFHFLTTEPQQEAYLRTLYTAVSPSGFVILATFASDGPQTCSGLPVRRYSAEELIASLGDRFEPIETRREDHVTPTGNIQPFIWLAGRVHRLG
jgi:cyclopropane fatty-acyl-phospholipid synthase-like methyltransferase